MNQVQVLAILGSPRRGGNTHVLLQQLGKGVAAAGGAFETIALAEQQITECDGCHVCWQGKECLKADDMNLLYPKIAACSVLVLGTPVYWYGPTALMKGFIDRFVYFNCPEHRPHIRGKQVAVVIPFEETEAATVRPVLEFFSRCLSYLEMSLVDQLVAPGVTRKGEVRKDPQLMAAAHRLGSSLVTGGGSPP